MTLTEPMCLLIADAMGRVAFHLGFACVGVSTDNGNMPTWREVLAGAICVDPVPEELPRGPTALSVTGLDGRELTLRILSMANGQTGYLVLLEPAASPPASDEQRMHALGMVAAGVAHEMNNLLTLGLGWLQLNMLDAPEAGHAGSPLGKVMTSMEQISALTGNLLDFARAPSGVVDKLDVNNVIRRTIALVDYQLEKADIIVEVDLADDVGAVRGSESELAQTMLNLLLNARAAMSEGGCLRVVSRREDGHVIIQVADTGCGIAPGLRERIFDPFFTTRKEHGGTGLGLPVCRQIIERHGGCLTVDSTPGEGAVFTIRVPAGAGSVALAE